ncbi:Zinc finger protein [Thalictrum thalictroides]|uniref:Zinc finger protein n=1 Tax=Thalictrum thalictroides TaxID=46969 RepID=A0A7J6UTK8_THATH|nr:Zinc finger protein [Thalictrum thalictroides]
MQVDHVVLKEEDLSSIVYRFDDQSDDYAFSQFEELHMDSSNAMEEEDDDDQMTTTSSNYSTLGHQFIKASSSTCSSDLRSNISDVSQESQVVNKNKKKKKGGTGFFPGLVLSLSNRRKGAPQRSPLL